MQNTEMAQVVESVPLEGMDTFIPNHQYFSCGWPGDARHYSDVIMSALASQIAGVSMVQPFVQAQIKENIKTPRHWPYEMGIHRLPVNSP